MLTGRVRRWRARPRGRGHDRARRVAEARPPVLAEADAARRRASSADDGPLVARSGPRRDPRRRQARRPDLARRRRPGAAARRDQARRSRRDARPVRVGRPAGLPRPRRRASSSTTSATARRYRATVCFGASSTTDDLEGELTPCDGPRSDPRRRSRRPCPASPARSRSGRRPTARSRSAGRRAYAMARAGETVELAEREVTIHALDIVSWDGTDPDRPIAVLDVACSAGHVHPGARPRPRRDGGERRVPRRADAGRRRARSRSTTPSRSTTSAPRPPTGPEGLLPLLRPIDTGLDAFPVVDADRRTSSRPSPAASSSARRAGCPARPTTTGCAARTARWWPSRPRRRGRLAPDKVFVVARRPSRAVGLTPRWTSSTGSTRCAPELGPVFVVVGVFDGLHLRPRLPARPPRRRGAAARRPADGHHLRPPPRRGPDRDRAAAPARPGRAARAARRRRRRGHGRPALRRGAARRRPTTRSSSGSARGSPLSGFLMTPDAAFGFERRGTPARWPTLGARDGFDVVVVPPFTSMAGRSAARRSARRSRAATWTRGAPARPAGHADRDGRRRRADGSPGSMACLRTALSARIGDVRRPRSTAGRVDAAERADGAASSPAIGPDGRVTVVLGRSSVGQPRDGSRGRLRRVVELAADSSSGSVPIPGVHRAGRSSPRRVHRSCDGARDRLRGDRACDGWLTPAFRAASAGGCEPPNSPRDLRQDRHQAPAARAVRRRRARGSRSGPSRTARPTGG